MRPNFSMPLAAASRACPSLVTSNGSLSSRGWLAMAEGSRAVATTASVARAASMIRAPNPRDAPVINHVFMCLFLLSAEIGERLADALATRTIHCRQPHRRNFGLDHSRGHATGDIDRVEDRARVGRHVVCGAVCDLHR